MKSTDEGVARGSGIHDITLNGGICLMFSFVTNNAPFAPSVTMIVCAPWEVISCGFFSRRNIVHGLICQQAEFNLIGHEEIRE